MSKNATLLPFYPWLCHVLFEKIQGAEPSVGPEKRADTRACPYRSVQVNMNMVLEAWKVREG